MVESETAAILTDCQALAAVWSILLPEATCPILCQGTCQKEKQQCSCLLWFCPRFIYNKKLFLLHKPRFIFNFPSCFGGKKGLGGQGRAINYHLTSVSSYCFMRISACLSKDFKIMENYSLCAFALLQRIHHNDC